MLVRSFSLGSLPPNSQLTHRSTPATAPLQYPSNARNPNHSTTKAAVQCLRVNNGHFARVGECPLYPRKRTIDHKIREAETRASNLAAPATLAEKSVHRKQEFQAALRVTLGALRVRDPSNKVWVEALELLGNPQLRGHF